ncbi:MAG: class I SAM-dependent methyltransferase [Candidatus Dormibacteraeota bacterium]|nr:class I SAM-dependent methyltransferase [Candidatus Dormibacteraeota bacterium]
MTSSSDPGSIVGTEGGRWAKGDAYERYLGRWSARVGLKFVRWLDAPSGAAWLDVGCGSGALGRAILDTDTNGELTVSGVDPSSGFVETAQALTADPRARFQVASAEDLPFDPGEFDLVVSGLVLNFLTDPVAGLREMARVCRSEGTVAGYVWDYTGEMWLLRHFWEAVFDLAPDARELDEVRRFAACRPEPLRELFSAAGLVDIEFKPLDETAQFSDFDDYWGPFLAGQGAAPSFVVSLPDATQAALGDALRQRLPAGPDGTIALQLRVWAIRGRVQR